MILAMPAALAANPPKPKIAAIRAITRQIMINRIMTFNV